MTLDDILTEIKLERKRDGGGLKVLLTNIKGIMEAWREMFWPEN
jgi:hypothetical protein